jgi:hypothetical protein
MDEFDVRQAADYLNENHESISAVIRKMEEQPYVPFTQDEMFDLRLYVRMNEQWLRVLNQGVNAPSPKKTKKFWKK